MAAKLLSLNDYEITKEGIIINKISNHIIKPQKNSKGYLRVILGKKKYFIHRLVAGKYIPNPNNFPQVNHIDGNKLNNNVNNLEWCTNYQNRQHALKNGLHLKGEQCSWAKLKRKDVDYIKENKNLGCKLLGEMFNVKSSTISSVIHNRSWK